jgi:ADP-ribose pyrophosphatase YjhB (NUDIX family)
VTLSLLPGPHPADLELAAPLAALWAAEQARRGSSLHDGSLLAVEHREQRADGIHLAVRIRPYRSYLARRLDPRLDLRCTPLGVTGVCVLPDGRWLLGRRSPRVTAAPGCWESVPAGSLDPKVCVTADGLAPQRQLLAELQEETGLSAAQAGTPELLGLLHDGSDDVYDLLYRLRPTVTADWRPAPSAEHTAFAACTPAAAGLLAATGAAIPALLPLSVLS